MIIEDGAQLKDLKNNACLGTHPRMVNSTINFVGENNLLIFEDNITFTNSTISFKGDNAVIYLSSNCFSYEMNMVIFSHSAAYVGQNNYFNEKLNVIISEGQNFILGNQCMFSFDIWIRNSDAHLIYDATNMQRINPSKSIVIGDHVWIGQHAMILKGSVIHSGSIVGAMSVLAGKTVKSNCSWAGNPAKRIQENIFWSGESVHSWTEPMTQHYSILPHQNFVFENDGQAMDMVAFDRKLLQAASVQDKARLLLTLAANKNKNRFYGA